jgi:outer membrane protein assembly factor BamB
MMRIVPVPVVVVSSLLLLCSLAAGAGENWPQWRGPNFDGSSKAKGLPDKIGPDQNMVWKAVMPGPSAGTPAVWEDAVFVSSLDTASGKLLAIRIDRKTGREIWRKEVGFGPGLNRQRNSMASPSPLTDGKHVWFHYATGDLACFDMDGKQAWTRNIVKDHGSFNFMWTYSSTPLLYKGKLYLQVLHNVKPYREGQPGESYLLAVDPGTGKDLWKVVRPTDAVNESQESYGTPIPFLSSERQEVVLVGGDAVTGHDAETGKELWRATGWNPGKEQYWRIITSPVTGGNMVFACAPKTGPVMAIAGGGNGTVPFAWQSQGKEFTSDVCVPLYYNDKLYVLDGDRKELTCVDPKTGKELWSGKLDSRPVFRASPTGADGKIYCMNEGGQVWVLSANEFKILGQADLGAGTNSDNRASVAAADGKVFVRTGNALYCFGAK